MKMQKIKKVTLFFPSAIFSTHYTCVLFFRQQNKVQLIRRGYYRSSDNIVILRLNADISRQQFAVAVRIPVALAAQYDGPVGGTIVGQWDGVGEFHLDGLPREGDGVAVPLPVVQAEGVYFDG